MFEKPRRVRKTRSFELGKKGGLFVGKLSRRKGYRGEKEAEEILRELGFDAKRVPLSGASEFQKGDVVVFEKGHPQWVVEVKRRARGFEMLYRFLERADLLFVRADRKDWIVCMELETLKKLWKRNTLPKEG